MLVLVTNAADIQPAGSVMTATGLDECRAQVTFAGDNRMMRGLQEYISENGPTECEVEPWQVLSREEA